jgi:hypothetical protein
MESVKRVKICFGSNPLKKKYLKNTLLLNATPSPQASWLLKGIVKNNHLVRNGAWYAIGNGETLSIWSDPPSTDSFHPLIQTNSQSSPN